MTVIRVVLVKKRKTRQFGGWYVRKIPWLRTYTSRVDPVHLVLLPITFFKNFYMILCLIIDDVLGIIKTMNNYDIIRFFKSFFDTTNEP